MDRHSECIWILELLVTGSSQQLLITSFNLVIVALYHAITVMEALTIENKQHTQALNIENK